MHSEIIYISCTGGVSYALFISPLISKLFCTRGEVGGEGGRAHLPSPSLRYWDEVNSLCPSGGGRGWLSDNVNSLCPCGGGRGGGGPFKGLCPKNHIKLTTCSTEYRIQNTEYRPQNTATAKLTYIKLPMYLFFFIALRGRGVN